MESFIEDLQTFPIIKKVDLTNKVLENIQQLKNINKLKSII